MPNRRRVAAKRASRRRTTPKATGNPLPTSRKPAHLITRAEMARRLGVSRPAVTQACRTGGRLHEACEGTAVNVLHDAARRWLSQRQAATADLPPLPMDDDEPERPARPAKELEEELGPGGLANLGDFAEPLTSLTERYGDARAFESWVKCRKALEEARKAEMLRERIEGRLIARTTVNRMLDHVDGAFRLMLSDAPRTIATRLAVRDTGAATALVRDVMSQILGAARDHMSASLAADDPMAPLAEAAE